MSLVVFDSLSLGFGQKTIVADLNLRIGASDRIGLIGPNGSGKTSLLRMLAGQQGWDSGSLRFARGVRVGYLAQDLVVEGGQTPEAVAQAAGVCPRTVRKWVDRYRREGLAGLHDRSSRPHRLRRPTPAATIERIEQLRRQRWTGKQIAAEAGVGSVANFSVTRLRA